LLLLIGLIILLGVKADKIPESEKASPTL